MNRRENTPANRKEDNDKVAAFNAFWDRWGRTILWPLIAAAAIYIREHYLKPIEAIPVLQAQQAKAADLDSASLKQRAEIVERLNGHDIMFQILVKMKCEERQPNSSKELNQLCRELPDIPAEQVRRILHPPGGF